MAGIASHNTGRSIFGSKNHYDRYYSKNLKMSIDEDENEYLTYEQIASDGQDTKNLKYNSNRNQHTYDNLVGDDSFDDDDMTEYSDDPVLGFLTTENITKNSFALVVRSLPVSDKPLIKYMNKAFHVFEELLALSKKISNDWEFIAMETDIQKAILTDHEENTNTDQKLFNTNIANIVMEKSLLFNQKFYELSSILQEVNRIVATFSPLQAVSDPGMVLATLSLKVIDLKTKVNEKINIVYAQAKLILMGADLDDLLHDFNLDRHADNDSNANRIIDLNHPIISNDLATTIEGYKDFVITILNQLHDARQQEDDEEINEVLAVIGDLEKMFEALMKQVYEPEVKSAKRGGKQTFNYNENDIMEEDEICVEDEIQIESDDEMHGRDEKLRNNDTHAFHSSSTNTFDNDTLYESDFESIKPKEKSVHSTIYSGLNNNLKKTQTGRTTLSDEMPYLLKAFENAKEAENEIRDTLKKSGIPNIPSSPVKEQKKSNDHLLSYSNSTTLPSPATSNFNISNNKVDSYVTSNLYSLSFFAASPTQKQFDTSHPLMVNKESIPEKPELENNSNSLTTSLFGSFGLFQKPKPQLALPNSVSKPDISHNESTIAVIPKTKPNFFSSDSTEKNRFSNLDNDID